MTARRILIEKMGKNGGHNVCIRLLLDKGVLGKVWGRGSDENNIWSEEMLIGSST